MSTNQQSTVLHNALLVDAGAELWSSEISSEPSGMTNTTIGRPRYGLFEGKRNLCLEKRMASSSRRLKSTEPQSAFEPLRDR